MTIQNFKDAQNAKILNEVNEEMVSSLSPAEKQLSKKLLLIEIKGKRGPKVPILIPPDAQRDMELLISKRVII